MTMIYMIILLAIVARFIPHAANFSPVYGALLLGGARLKKWDSIWFPLLLLAGSDLFLTTLVYHQNVGWWELFQVTGFAAIAVAGWLMRHKTTWRRLTLACAAGPTAFYLISNFGVWLGWQSYPRTFAGLVDCYAAGVPFYGYSLVSTFVFAALLFGLYEFYALRHLRGPASDARPD
jgi:uncharacterized protein DUF6580